MKYLFLLTILFGCGNKQKKVLVAHTNKDTTVQASSNSKYDCTFVNRKNLFSTRMHTTLLNKVMGKIVMFPEVENINEQIYKSSKGKHGVTFFVHDEFVGDTLYYDFEVGDNSHEDRYVNIYNFLLEKKTGLIKVYDPTSDSILSLKNWRKKRKIMSY